MKQQITIALVIDCYKYRDRDSLFQKGFDSQEEIDISQYKLIKEKKLKGPTNNTMTVKRTYALKAEFIQ